MINQSNQARSPTNTNTLVDSLFFTALESVHSFELDYSSVISPVKSYLGMSGKPGYVLALFQTKAMKTQLNNS